MIRSAFRLLGLILLAIAFVALIIDGTRSIAAGSFATTTFGATILWALPGKLESLQPHVEHFSAFLWDPVLLDFLRLPTWSIAGFFGFLAIAFTKKRPHKIGYSNRD